MAVHVAWLFPGDGTDDERGYFPPAGGVPVPVDIISTQVVECGSLRVLEDTG